MNATMPPIGMSDFEQFAAVIRFAEAVVFCRLARGDRP